MKVYILITDSVYDYESSQGVQTFGSLKAAKEQFDYLTESFALDENDMNWVCEYHNEKSCLYQEEGDYTRNHIEWTIYEQEIVNQEEFPVLTLMREDLEQKGFDTSNLGDEWMEKIASKVGDILLDSDYWDHLVWAAEYYKVPRKEEDEP